MPISVCHRLKYDWNPGTWLLIWEYSMRAFWWIPTWQDLDDFQNSLSSCALDECSLGIERVNMTVNIVWWLSSCALVVSALKGLIWHYSFHLFLLIGLSKEGWHIFKNLAAELLILLFGFFTFVPAIQVNHYSFLDSRLCRRPRGKKFLAAVWKIKGWVLCMFYVEWELGGQKKT